VAWSSACNMTGASSWPPTRSFSRIFQGDRHPLFFCDRWARRAISTLPCGAPGAIRANAGFRCPYLWRELSMRAEDRERFRRVITQPGAGDIG